MNRRLITVLILCTPLLATADTVRLADIGLDPIRQDGSRPAADGSVGGHPLTLGGKVFDHGVGSRTPMLWWINLAGSAERFTATVGVDDEVKVPRTLVQFQVVGDRKTLFSTGNMLGGNPPKAIDLDLHGIQTLVLAVTSNSRSPESIHVDWADAVITYTGQRPVTVAVPAETTEVLTPLPPHEPRINGAAVFGVRPGHPVLYTVAVTGDRPMLFAADGLPAGLSLDPSTGRITGSVSETGQSIVTLTATNALGTARRQLRIEVGPTVALTPPMGWNSWYCFGRTVTDEKIRAAADVLVNSGLVNHGWTYINIDDCWEVRASEPPENRRTADGFIKSNKNFPDMKALADYIHSKGLRAGLYSSPGPSTCGGYTASYQYEEQDARQYAAWGFDYLKYDWCSYSRIANPNGRSGTPQPPLPVDVLQHPYLVMRDALLKQNRDIVFSFCQYGLGNVWEWGEKTGGNCWRTAGDIGDNWLSMSGIGFSQAGHEKYAGPGHWNDLDMLMVDKIGFGPALHQTHLTPNEQYTQMTLWSLLSAPLLIGCDMTQLDDFTLGLLTNDEVIAVSQDPLGRQAGRVYADDEGVEVWAKDLDDGSKAVGLFNRGEMPNTVTAKWSDLGLSGKQSVRDLWRQKDLGEFDGQYSVEVPRHGVVLIKVGR